MAGEAAASALLALQCMCMCMCSASQASQLCNVCDDHGLEHSADREAAASALLALCSLDALAVAARAPARALPTMDWSTLPIVSACKRAVRLARVRAADRPGSLRVPPASLRQIAGSVYTMLQSSTKPAHDLRFSLQLRPIVTSYMSRHAM